MTVRSEVEGKLAQYAATKGIPVAYENVSFTKPTSGNWIEIYFLSNNSVLPELSASRRREYGMIQINVYGKPGVGMGAITTQVNEVVALFPVVPKAGVTSIEAPPSVGRAMQDGEFIFVPITVQYRAEF